MNLTLNINDRVSVELTEEGLKHLKKYWSHIDLPRDLSIPGLKENVLTTELWDVMSIFGPKIYMGGPQFFKTNQIKLITNEN